MSNVRPTTQHDYHERLNRVLLYIEQHRAEKLTLERLATVACLSPFHFHRIFRAMVGESTGRYVQRIRLETAAVNLQTTSRTVLEIALDAGYESTAAFSRAFQERFGMAPSACRHAHRLELSVRKARQRRSMPTNIKPEIRQRPDTRVAFVRHTGRYADVGQAWEKVCGFIGSRGLFRSDTCIIGIGLDDPKITPEENIRYDACVTVGPDFKPHGEVGAQTIPGGRYAVFLHAGPYEKLIETYDRIFCDWLPGSGEELKDQPAFELYLNSPDRVPPDALRTEIWVPLKGK
ncbi:AraC family transcriptional regulator [Opitutus sp. ER46]|uniref:AraC family transcriptional regulator n=1 Tax=Opitutus sp. ER46 TaxID=2161864 RepID=UPI000D314212|nr:AraC family transcriptional regulator [Opitutus sp. ER46]PTX94524.1 AraC family transcriptional regulator [Opitutus sp. ER46]